MKIASAITLIVATLFGGAALAQPAQQIFSGRPAAVDPQVKQCTDKNSALHKEIVDMFQNAQKVGKIDSKEFTQFKDTEASLAKLAEDLKKGGLTLAECNQYGAALALEKTKVTAMAKAREGVAVNTAKVVECRQRNLGAHKAVVEHFIAAKNAGKIDAKEMEAFKAAEAALNKHAAELNKDGLTLAECDSLGAEIAKEKTKVDGMVSSSAMAKAAAVAKAAASDPKLTECVAKNVAEQTSILAILYKAKQEGRVDANAAVDFAASELALAKLAVDLKKGGLTLAECQTVTTALAKERGRADKLAASPVKKK